MTEELRHVRRTTGLPGLSGGQPVAGHWVRTGGGERSFGRCFASQLARDFDREIGHRAGVVTAQRGQSLLAVEGQHPFGLECVARRQFAKTARAVAEHSHRQQRIGFAQPARNLLLRRGHQLAGCAQNDAVAGMHLQMLARRFSGDRCSALGDDAEQCCCLCRA